MSNKRLEKLLLNRGGNYKMQISSTATIRHSAEESREQYLPG